MPRVPDERAGVCNRAGLLGGGLGLLVNIHQQCQMWQSGGLLTVGHIGEHLWAGNFIFGKE